MEEKMDIKVSIIIPVYNVALFLDACLSSCVNQSFRDIEIIVINDGSTDESSRIISRYAAQDERIVVITKANEGVVIARQYGLNRAQGEYVYFLDGDDYIETNTIEILYNEVIKNGADYVVSNYYEIVGNKRYEIWRNNRMKGLSGQDLLLCMLRGGFELCMRLIRKSLFDDIIQPTLVIGEDLFTTMQIMLKVKNPMLVEACLYNYVRHEGSITKRNDELVWKYSFEMVRAVYSLLDIYPYRQDIRDRVYLMFFTLFLTSMSYRRKEVKDILYDFYWSKKEMKKFLWEKRKIFYLITGSYLQCPFFTAWIAKMGLGVITYVRKSFYILNVRNN